MIAQIHCVNSCQVALKLRHVCVHFYVCRPLRLVSALSITKVKLLTGSSTAHVIIFSTSIRSGPANTAGSENSIPAEKPTKKLACVGVGDREEGGGGKGRGIGERESSLSSSLSPSPLSLQAKKERISDIFGVACLSLSPQSPSPSPPSPYLLPLSTPATQAIFCQPVFLWHDSSEDSGSFSRSDAWV